MFPAVSDVPPSNADKTLSSPVVSGWNSLAVSDNLAQPLLNDAEVDLEKAGGRAITSFCVESTSTSGAILASDQDGKASSNIGGRSALTATCSSDHLDTEQNKYDAGDKTSRQASLLKARKSTYSIRDLYFKYQKCGKVSRRQAAINRHEPRRTDKTPWGCQFCNKFFLRKYNLDMHIMTHSNKHPFHCDKCGVRFNRKSSLTRHERIHSNGKPRFSCDICSCTFTRKDKFIMHTRTHGERRFKCTVCGYTFRQKTYLDDHMASVHSNERPFLCDKCGVRFKRKRNLNAHKKNHSDERFFICDICEAGFKRKFTLETHQKTHADKRPYESGKSRTDDRISSQTKPDHGNEKSFESSHRYASSTSIKTSSQHMKPETHTTYSETRLTNPGNVPATSQLPFRDDQPSTSGIHVNKSRGQEEAEEGIKEIDYDYFQTVHPPVPSWDSSCSCDDCDCPY